MGLLYGEEEFEGTGGAVTGEDEVEFFQASIGAELSQSFATGSAFFGVHIDYQDADSDTVLASDIIINDGTTGRLEVGGSWTLQNGTEFDASLEFSGIGGDISETSGALRATFRF